MSLLWPITVEELGLRADRPRNTSLNVDALQQIWDVPVPTVAAAVEAMVSEIDPFPRD